MALVLIAPLFLFTAFTFFAPIGTLLSRAVLDSELADAWPRTAGLIRGGAQGSLPNDEAFAALAEDVRDSFRARTLAGAARRLNYALPNGYGLVMAAGRRFGRGDPVQGSAREAFAALDPAWDSPETWAAIRAASGPASDFFLLAAFDLERDLAGRVRSAPAGEAIYREVFRRTFAIAATVTALCVILGFPVAYLAAHSSPAIGNLVLILVLLPFWTSLLVRTAAWFVLLQDQGLVNQALIGLGLTAEPLRLIFNRVGVVVAMTHVLLPFLILPLYATMRTVPPALMRAARSLGAPPATAFLRVYLPQTVPGLAAGALLVFILALGYYITPALVGGSEDQMVSYFVAFYTTQTVNWGLAAALGAILLAATLLLYVVYARLVGSTRVSLG